MGAASAGGTSLVEVGNSALFTGSTPNLQITNGTPTSTTKWSFSLWFYRGSNYTTGANQVLISDDDSNYWALNMSDVDKLEVWWDGSSNEYKSEQVFRDVGWYHCVVATDTSQATVSNRLKVYINGERITMTITNSAVSQNETANIGTDGGKIMVGSLTSGGPRLGFQGYFSEFCFIDGTQSVPSDFGQYDSTGTFWTPKSAAEITALTFGNNGFYLPFSNSSDVGEDFSGNNNDLTNNNTVVTDTHTPTNIEFLMSPINVTDPSDNPVLTNGNRTWSASSSSAQTRMGGNIPFPSSGKWIAGVIITELSDGKAFGIWSDRTDGDGFPSVGGFSGWHRTSVLVAYESDGSTVLSDTNWPQGTTQAVGDQCWIAVDIDNSKTFFGYYDLSADAILWYANDAGNDGNPATGDNPFEENFNCAGMVWAGAAQNSKSFTLVKEADCPFTIPTGYSFLSTTNLASAITRTHSNLEEYFDTTLYEGNGAGQRVGKFLPFTNTFTVANSALFNGTNNSLDRTQVAGTSAGTVWTFSAWIKKCENKNTVYVNWGTGGTQGQLGFDASGNFVIYDGSTTVGVASREFEDSSQWSHYHVAYDTGESGTDKVKLTINGVLITNWSTDNRSSANAFQNVGINGEVMRIGNNASAGSDAISLNGYMAQVVFLDGTASAASNFGQLDTSTGRWIPSDLSSFSFGSGNNTVFLDFADSDNLGDDESGQGHDFTNVNTVTQTADSPTVNIATLNSNDSAGGTISNGNKTLVTTGNSDQSTRATIRLPNTGKYYWELNLNIASASGATGVGHVMSLNNDGLPLTTGNGSWTDNVLLTQDGSGSVQIAQPSGVTALFTFSGTASINDKYQIAVDIDNHKLWFGINNSFFNSSGGTDGNPSTGANPTISQNFAGYVPMFGNFNTNQTVRFDSADWTYTQPTDYVSLTQDSLPTGESYQTAFSWIKNRDATDNHMLFDRVRGIYKDVHSNEAAAEVTNVNTLQRFLNGGVQVGNDVEVNTASESYAAWNWYMETTGSGTSNTDGTINTTATLVDTNIGLSISQFTGTGSNATIGHGLGVVPQMYWVKGIDAGDHWYVYHANNTAAPQTDALLLNGTGATFDDATLWNDTAPTSSVISLGSNTGINQSSKKYLAMAFAPSQFTSIGSYKSNANANGPFVPTINSLGIPIQPAWVMVKDTSGASQWWIWDNQRSPFNLSTKVLYPNLSNAESTSVNISIDMVEGGFKLRTSSNPNGSSGNTYIYLAFGTPIIDVDGRIITGR